MIPGKKRKGKKMNRTWKVKFFTRDGEAQKIYFVGTWEEVVAFSFARHVRGCTDIVCEEM